jgi:surface protein
MSINLASDSGINNSRRDLITPGPVVAPIPYVRPADWLALPTLSTATPQFAGLWAVFNTTYNNVDITCSAAGGFSVDWGDGTSPVTYVTGATASYNYTYSAISAGTLSTRGYKQVVITVTPITTNGDITSMTLNSVPTGFNSGSLVSQWLDLALACTSAMTVFSTAGVASYLNAFTEQVTIDQVGGLQPMVNFSSMTGLRNVILPSTSASTVAPPLFGNCFNLQNAPNISLPLVTNMANTFANCVNLKYIPPTLLSNIGNATTFTTMGNAFNGCTALAYVPPISFNGTSGVSFNGTFSGCSSLVTAPLITNGTINDMANVFNGGSSLTRIPLLNTSSVTSMADAFNNCVSLTSVPLFNTSSVTDMSRTFFNCVALTSVPLFNTSNNTIMINTFANCRSLTSVPLLDTTKVIYMADAFSNCVSLTSIPLFNTANVTSLESTFAFCSSLTSIAALNTIKNTSMTQMLLNANALTSLPSFNTSNVIFMTNAFANCTQITTSPSFDTSKVNTFNFMFANCGSLQSLPVFSTANIGVSGIAGLARGCTQLLSFPALNLTTPTSYTTPPWPIGIRNSNVTNVKGTHSYANSGMGNVELTTVITNLASNAATRTITITNSPGADTALSKTGTWSFNSNVITMANTVGLSVGYQISQANISTSTAATGNFTLNANGKVSTTSRMDSNTIISFTTVVTSNLLANTLYYTSNVSGTSPFYYNISTTPGGTALTFTAGTGNGARINTLITAINTNANIILNSYPLGNGTAAAVSLRNLNTNIATGKGWTVTG